MPSLLRLATDSSSTSAVYKTPGMLLRTPLTWNFVLFHIYPTPPIRLQAEPFLAAFRLSIEVLCLLASLQEQASADP